ncbi:MAG: mechanosensitive ion channel family protein, partial [Acinetobacter sp.]|nr:mechanosensitive ion channel family protein [Acinetobacter sp.]
IQELVVTAFDEKGISIPYPVQEVKVYRGDQSEQADNSDKQAP